MTMKRKFRPTGPRLLVKLKHIEQEKEVKSEFGVILETKTDSRLLREQYGEQQAYIVSIGSTAFDFGDKAPWCKPGDLVLIAKYSGEDRDDIEEDEIYRVINDVDVLGVFEGEEVEVEKL